MRRGLLSIFVVAAGVRAAPQQEAAAYDYIVVGSGPGGGPLACDLARAGYSTLLLEAGEDHSDYEAYSELQNFNWAANDDQTRWDFWVKHSDDPKRELEFDHTVWREKSGVFYVGKTPPEGAKHLGIHYPRAGALGGCAQHNAGVSTLPADDDWNVIAKKTGDSSWEAANMRKHFIKLEKNEYLPRGTPGHGFDGWLSVTTGDPGWARNSSLPATKVLKKMAELFGEDTSRLADLINRDINGPEANRDTTSTFYSMVQHADKQGKRSSPLNYIKSTLADPKKYPLTVKMNTLVTKVLFDDNKKAIGVELMEGKSLYRADPRYKDGTKGPLSKVLAAREVIVSGGTFNSPQILKLSGIGPAEELKKFNISVVSDLPGVGENLGDNYEDSLLGLSKAPIGGGLITVLFKTPTAPKNRNIFAWCGPFSFEGFWPGFPTDHGPTQYECALCHMGAKSQAGSVKLVSADPQDTPDINFRFFERGGDQDLQELVDAANMLRTAWQAAGEDVLPINELHPCPGTSAGKDCTNEQMKNYFKLQAYSHHPTSTCAIGADNDKMAVLDSKFRVRGVKGLRVVDASIFPQVPGSFPVLPTYMISTKAAEDIIAERKAEKAM